jgi:hypothetical protein
MTLAVEPKAEETEVPKAPASEAAPSAAPQAQATAAAEIVEAAEDISTLRAQADDLRRKLETAEKKRIPDLQSKLDRTEGKLHQREEQFTQFNTQWWQLLEGEVRAGNFKKERYDELMASRTQASSQATATKAQQSDGQEIALALYRNDEPELAAFISELLEAGNVVTKANLGTYRSLFERMALKKADEEPKPKPAAKVPPKVPGGGGAISSGEGPAWKPGTRSGSLLAKSFAARAGKTS